LRDDYHLDPRAAQNLLTFLREQAAATGIVPSDRPLVLERVRAAMRASGGLAAQSLWSADGLALPLPEADAPPSLADLLIGPDEVEELVVGEVGQRALFRARFRENAARA